MKLISHKEIMDDKDTYAKLFSEGNMVLENLLQEVWGRGLETIGCCKGHETKPFYNPYICFDVKKGQEEFYSRLYSKFYKSMDECRMFVSKTKEGARIKNFLSISYLGDKKYSTMFFQKIEILFRENFVDKANLNKIALKAKHILSYNNFEDFQIRMLYDKSKDTVEFFKQIENKSQSICNDFEAFG